MTLPFRVVGIFDPHRRRDCIVLFSFTRREDTKKGKKQQTEKRSTTTRRKRRTQNHSSFLYRSFPLSRTEEVPVQRNYIVVTISSRFLESILSPADPEADERLHAASTPPAGKRKHADAFVAQGGGGGGAAGSLGVDLAPSLDGRSQTSTKSDTTGSETGRAHAEETRQPTAASGTGPATGGSRKETAKLARLRPPMRSSIACLRCRRSKIKCDNDGGNSPCETCLKAGQDCQYPDGAPVRSRRVDHSSAAGNHAVDREDPPERKRSRKADNVSGTDPERAKAYAAEVLSYPFLTTQVWDKVFAIYKLHFTAELPFIHLATLKDTMLRSHEFYRYHPNLNIVLLGLLALAAPFYPELAKYAAHVASLQGIKPREPLCDGDLSIAGDFFANALLTALGPLRRATTEATVERCQAFLMLSLYEWHRRQKDSAMMAWIYLGLATRQAQALKLGLDDKYLLLGEPSPFNGPLFRPTGEVIDIGVTREVRRRTMFSCLILDRMLACGKERPPIIRVEDLEIQLPCPELSFDLSQHANTGFLRTFHRNHGQSGTENSVLSLFIQLADIWGEITKYSVEGGRTLDEGNPTSNQSRFGRLHEELEICMQSLSGTFALSRQNYYRHDSHNAASTYVSLHMFISVCQIILHREYLPFLPLRKPKAAGPVNSSQPPEDFTKTCARRAFQAARDIVDLTEICRDKLPMTPLTLFAAWTAGFMGIYAHHFPHMDSLQYMSGWAESGGQGNDDVSVYHGSLTGIAYQTMLRMIPYLGSAHAYAESFREMDAFFGRIKAGNLGLEKLSIRSGSERSSISKRGGVTSLQHSKEGQAPASDPAVERTAAFTAVNSPVLGWQHRPVPPQPERGSLFILPEVATEATKTRQWMWEAIRGFNPLDADTMATLEVQRIVSVLNDLQEFAGAGAVGGAAWESADGRGREEGSQEEGHHQF